MGILSICENYFQGFQDVAKHETPSSTFRGIAKILSYITVVPPISLALIHRYEHIKILNKINTILDFYKDEYSVFQVNRQSIHTKLSFIKANVIFHKEKDVIQDKLIDYALDQLTKIDPVQKSDELDRFKKAFYLLTPQSQIQLFNKASSKSLLGRMICCLPTDIEELHVGYTYSPRSRGMACVTGTATERSGLDICAILNCLSGFTQLKHLHLDLTGLGDLSKKGPKQEMKGFATAIAQLVSNKPHLVYNINFPGGEYQGAYAPPSRARSFTSLHPVFEEF